MSTLNLNDSQLSLEIENETLSDSALEPADEAKKESIRKVVRDKNPPSSTSSSSRSSSSSSSSSSEDERAERRKRKRKRKTRKKTIPKRPTEEPTKKLPRIPKVKRESTRKPPIPAREAESPLLDERYGRKWNLWVCLRLKQTHLHFTVYRNSRFFLFICPTIMKPNCFQNQDKSTANDRGLGERNSRRVDTPLSKSSWKTLCSVRRRGRKTTVPRCDGEF